MPSRARRDSPVVNVPLLEEPNHTSWGAWIETKAPTCTESGTATNICAVCSKELTKDVDAILLVVDIALRMLKIGTEVNDGIDAWISLGNKLWNLFRKRKIVSVDIDGATSIAIALIAQREKIVKLEKLQEATINLVDLSSMLPQNVGLSKAPHNYYIQTYRINDDEIYVVGITSEGKANVIKHFGYSRYRIKDVK